MKCDGCGRIASDVDQTPWSYWLAMRPGSDLAIFLGVVKPIPCPECLGKGETDDRNASGI